MLDLTFTAPGTIDFTNISDVKNLSVSNSTAAVALSNLPNDIEKIFIKDAQSGDWNISYFPNSFATLFLEWTNNTGIPVDLTSLSINEVGQFLLKTTGNENITIPTLNLDPDDTQRIEIGNDNDGNIICLDQQSGEMLWRSFAGGEVLSKVSIDASLIVVKTASGFLNAFNINNGNPDWSYRSQTPILTVRGSSAPIIDDAFVYATFDNGRLGAFSLKTGLPIWDGAISYVKGVSELENLIDSDSSPVVDGGLIYTTNYQGNLNIFDTAQKRSVWSYETSSFYSPIVSRGMLTIVEANSGLRSFALKTLQESWTNDDYINRDLSNAVSYKGSLVVGDFEGYVHVIDTLNGKTIGRKKISRKPIKSILSRSDSLYIIDEAFNLHSINI